MIAIDEKRLEILEEKISNLAEYLIKNQNNETSSNNTTLELMTVKEASKYLNISEISVRKMIERREIKFKKIRTAIRIEKSELDKLVK
ncbi:MAG: helix-turn-helix domain-containing protein [Halarcobacter sp.]